MAAKLKIEKRGDEIKKEYSPLKILSQSQPNFAEMILGLIFGREPSNDFHQHLVLIEQMVSNKNIFMGISHRVLC
jgi:hypothetical protein